MVINLLNYYGIDARGTASYSIDEEAIVKNIFDIDVNREDFSSVTIAEIINLSESFKVSLDKKENLSNEDKRVRQFGNVQLSIFIYRLIKRARQKRQSFIVSPTFIL
ncbi:hypothetical protein A0U40_03660 [[Bacillus] sp. KCTC 13219]|nr:hypothetical protein A0U40_03660 [[Bacillus] sp. KCTC 13219]